MARQEFSSRLREGILPVPPLPVLPTSRLIEVMGAGNWSLAGVEEIRGTNSKKIISPWIDYLGLAEEACTETQPTAELRGVNSAIRARGAWEHARNVLGGSSEETRDLIVASKRAFSALLGEEEMEPGDPEKARELIRCFQRYIFTNLSVDSNQLKVR